MSHTRTSINDDDEVSVTHDSDGTWPFTVTLGNLEIWLGEAEAEALRFALSSAIQDRALTRQK